MRRSLLLALFCLVAGTAAARADLIFLKDGFVLNGKVRKENITVVDPVSKETYNYPKFFLVDDGPRRYYFAPAQMQQTDTSHARAEDTVKFPRRWSIPNPKTVPPIYEVLDPGTFDDKWDRDFKFRTVIGEVSVPQHLAILNSHYAELHALKYFPWYSIYLTQELGADTVRKLLIEHPEFQDPPGLIESTRIERRFRLYHFLVHAGWFVHAGNELDRIARDFPAARKRVEEAREKLLRMQMQQYLDTLQRAQRAGRRKWVAEQLPFFAEKYATPKVQDEFRTLKASVAAEKEKFDLAGRLLDDLLERVTGEEKLLFAEAVPAVKAELYAEALGRLELFLEQAKQAERQRRAKGKADLTDGQLLSLAVTGWLLGNAASETKVETARRLWRGRQLILGYVNGNAAAREQLKERTQRELPSIDEALLLIASLPPLKPDEKLPEGVTEQKVNGITYSLQLPDEYHPGRPYPVLLALHHGIEGPKEMMDRLGERAKEEGYILAAPAWPQQAGGVYGFSDAEHQTVLETLMDLRRRFHVDSDRVFLMGMGVGATMAFDVGMSHPDLFAGVLPVCGMPEYFARHYWSNAQYLPFYVVSGDCMGPASKQVRELFEKWVPHAYPSIHAQYKGRGQEWYAGEVGSMFEWMARKRRSAPTTTLGRPGPIDLGDPFVSFRPTDNRFYWVSTDAIDPRHHNRVPGWQPRLPATMTASINPNQNQIFVTTTGYRQVTVWLARDARLDFDKPITLRVNGNAVINNRKVQPSLATLLDDFTQRLDRHRLFVGRLDVVSIP